MSSEHSLFTGGLCFLIAQVFHVHGREQHKGCKKNLLVILAFNYFGVYAGFVCIFLLHFSSFKNVLITLYMWFDIPLFKLKTVTLGYFPYITKYILKLA